ncbi:hypothetical protein CHUAL_008245 [Chamberlinius hualienensis]
MLLLLLVFGALLSLEWELVECANSCVSRNYGFGSIVCVCNSTYCDDIGEISSVPNGKVLVYTSSKSGLRFQQQLLNFGSCQPNYPNLCNGVPKLAIDLSDLKQNIYGFGGAFTDSAGININSLSAQTKSKLLESYFGPTGIEYTIGRIPMGASDFSTHFYTYQDNPKIPFQLASEDYVDKIPLIHTANSISKRQIRYFSTPWGSPLWMREDSNIKKINQSYYPQWAQYFANFIDAYKANNVTIWAVTSQNEPFFGSYLPELAPSISFAFQVFSTFELMSFITKNLRPTLKSKHPNVKLMVVDDNTPFVPLWQLVQAMDSSFCQSFDGTAIHWYYNSYINYNVTFSELHQMCPDNFILSSEACNGVMINPNVQLGSWENAELYANDIIKDLQNMVTGWVDWNMALDTTGGPNWMDNFVDSPIIVNKTEDVFMKQPMYYALGHFSKFIPPGFRVVNMPIVSADKDIEVVAAAIEKNSTLANINYDVAAVVLNKGNTTKSLELEIRSLKGSPLTICATIPAKAIQTYIWKLT